MIEEVDRMGTPSGYEVVFNELMMGLYGMAPSRKSDADVEETKERAASRKEATEAYGETS